MKQATNRGAMRELILASTSPWRRRLLEAAGVSVRCLGSRVDESTIQLSDPAALVRALAEAKARAVSAHHPKAVVLGADQVAYDPQFPSDWFGKPTDPDDHFARLAAMRGRQHVLVTGWVLIGPRIHRVQTATTTLLVRSDLTDEEIRAYVATGEGSQCAGGYAAEGLGGFLFERIEGDWFNVLGLPLFDVMSALRELGWRFADDR